MLLFISPAINSFSFFFLFLPFSLCIQKLKAHRKMLYEDEDPLGNSIFDTTSNSILGNTMTTSMFSSGYEEDPWGSHMNTSIIPSSSAAIITPATNDMGRSFTTPNLYHRDTTSDAADSRGMSNAIPYNSSTVLCK